MILKKKNVIECSSENRCWVSSF